MITSPETQPAVAESKAQQPSLIRGLSLLDSVLLLVSGIIVFGLLMAGVSERAA